MSAEAARENIAKAAMRKASSSSSYIDYYCCFRDGRRGPPLIPVADCCPTEADRKATPGGPEGVKLDPDAALLELRGVLRYHRIDPDDSLLHDVMRWGTRMQPGS
eukprot:TRINITY_DN6423_c0_g1_i2.p2 TRINITY_DN6423_c0_g1~~TRINITY_DN6423_c0_g1_i2.p2  ORF type:complete len:105 (+),score=15.08 TRINITY_DN6423_c0_g1_i2:189-503(+)